MQSQADIWHVHSYGGDRQNIAVQEWWFDNNERTPENHCCLQFVIEGSVKIRFGQEAVVVPAGGAFIFYYGEDSGYGMDVDTGTRCACEFIVFQGRGLPGQFAMLSAEFGNAIMPEQAHQLLGLSRSMLDRARQHVSADQTHAIPAVYQFIGSMFSILEQGKHSGRKPVDRAIHRVVNNPLYPWSIKSVVADSGCSREHFTRVFQERYQHSPADWLNKQRVKHAIYLLQHTFMTVADIAVQSGFSSTHTMARLIRQETGSSPSQIRT